MSPTPLERYQQDLASADFHRDAAQEAVVHRLQALYEALLQRRREETSLLRRLGWFRAPPEPVTGLYLWGGVGRGKTYLMDTFFETLPFERKLRAHFHRFMRRVHRELKAFAGEPDPLENVAERLSREARVICFDEFFVSDITDAMILGTLLRGLFRRGVCLVATSNIVPDELYKDGLQRERFLPAIDLLNRYTRVVHLDSPTDYRLRVLQRAELYYSPLDAGADESLWASFRDLCPETGEIVEHHSLEVEGRPIPVRAESEDVVWFDFDAICDGPRSQLDYIELAREYHAVLISNVPALGTANEDQARRFISLVDEFYDRNVKLVLSAAQPLTELYGEGKLKFEFQRTVSRLLEMQSLAYLARPHKP